MFNSKLGILEMTEEYSIEVDKIAREDWAQIMLLFDDASIFQGWEYGAAKWGEDNLSHLILRRSGEIVAAAQLWYVKFPGIGGGFAHVSMGPMWRLKGQRVNYEHIRNMVSALSQEFSVKRRALVRIYSYEKENEEGNKIAQILESEGFKQTDEPHDVTMRVDLSPDIDCIRSSLHKKWRRKLKKAEQNDLEIINGTDDETFNCLCDVYREMLDRKQFTFQLADLEQLQEAECRSPQCCKLRVFLCKCRGEVIGGVAISMLGDTAVEIFKATSNKDNEQNLRSTFLFDWHAVKWLKEHGYKYLDLRGYDPSKYPGPSQYKAGMGGEVVTFLGIYERCDSFLTAQVMKVGKYLHSTFPNMKLVQKILN
ncbi:MAG: GNAT family N-acetyltransferase [Gemmatimonadota bacterium]|nr:MAG: GNAT family N-acetyltransferase [Gemmatimonadota bacterium]